jgi:hypothetical protein
VNRGLTVIEIIENDCRKMIDNSCCNYSTKVRKVYFFLLEVNINLSFFSRRL